MGRRRVTRDPVNVLFGWVRRQFVKVKTFLAVVSVLCSLITLKFLVRDQGHFFVASEAIHTAGIIVLIYKLTRQKTCSETFMDKNTSNTQEVEVRKGPWTMEEDLILINYIANHGEGVWNSLARSAGLKRTGKSCRLRWLNYLRPDVRRGNITPEEQLLIMELHARWGNRWSKIARHLPGRTDNEIKNYWRTRIQKQIKQAEPSANQNYTLTHEASTSHACGAKDEVDLYSPAYTMSNPEPFATPLPTESNDCFWSMEDLWFPQLFNGD